MEVFMIEEWSSRNKRTYSLHFNSGLSPPACKRAKFNTDVNYIFYSSQDAGDFGKTHYTR
jgi:hypothetical protein